MFPDFEDTGITMSDKDAVQAEWNARLESIRALHLRREATIPGEVVCSNMDCKLSFQPADEKGLTRQDRSCYLCGCLDLIPVTEELRNTRQIPDPLQIPAPVEEPVLQTNRTATNPALPGKLPPAPIKPIQTKYRMPLFDSPVLGVKFLLDPHGAYWFMQANGQKTLLSDLPLQLLRLIYHEAKSC
jgi:hypothetical protein